MLYTVAPTLGAGKSEDKLLMAGPGPQSVDRRQAWYGQAYANGCAQAGCRECG